MAFPPFKLLEHHFTLSELFEGLDYEEFQFRNLGSIQNGYCISLPHILYVPKGGHLVREESDLRVKPTMRPTPTAPKLAVHINFNCEVSGLRTGDWLNLAITAFHLTARPVSGQLTIDEHGPSVLTAKESIHINCNTGWGRRDNLEELLRKLNVGLVDGPSMDDLLDVLRFNFPTQKSMPYFVKEAKEKIVVHMQHRTKIMNITFNGSDKTFPFDSRLAIGG